MPGSDLSHDHTCISSRVHITTQNINTIVHIQIIIDCNLQCMISTTNLPVLMTQTPTDA